MLVNATVEAADDDMHCSEIDADKDADEAGKDEAVIQVLTRAHGVGDEEEAEEEEKEEEDTDKCGSYTDPGGGAIDRRGRAVAATDAAAAAVAAADTEDNDGAAASCSAHNSARMSDRSESCDELNTSASSVSTADGA